MAKSRNKAVVERYLTEGWGKGNLAVIDETLAEEFTFRMGHSRKETRGKEGMKQIVLGLRQVFPDLWLRIDVSITERDVVAVQWTSGGTQKGEWKKGTPPTEKTIEWTGISIYHLKAGRILREGGEENMLGLLEQMGLIQRR